MATAGYSGTPLPKKLGIGPDSVVVVLGPVPDDLDLGVPVRSQLRGHADVVVFFTVARKALEQKIARLGDAVFPDGGVWIVWPKRASGVTTDMTEDVVRDVVLPLGLVDNKVCAIDETWSGLRVVWRKERRG